VARFVAGAVLLFGATFEFYEIAWGTGTWLGQFSLKWAVAFGMFSGACGLGLLALGMAIRDAPKEGNSWRSALEARERLGFARWLPASIAIALPAFFFQYTPWGVVVSKPFLRLFAWSLASLLAAFFLTRGSARAWTWRELLTGALLCGSSFVLLAPFGAVSSYPFSLGWSEGNRLWDYSLLFGKRLYLHPSSQEPAAYLDIGRQLVGGLPFLLPHVSILPERAWLAAVAILPYIALSLIAFWPSNDQPDRTWILAGIWGFMFLSQGPIHAPLVICGVLVALACRRSNWSALVLMAVAGYFAEVSRFTWMFAPAMWAVMIEVGGARLKGGRIPKPQWRRALLLAVGGLLGSGAGVVAGLMQSGTSLGAATGASTKQALLWYRLLPNATYGSGILLGLLMAAGPLVGLLLFLGARYWKHSLIQRTSVVLPLTAFLLAGLIISTKIGGGGDLHNMDMFLIGLLLAAAGAWRAVGGRWLADLRKSVRWMPAALTALLAIPAFGPLMGLRPLSIATDADWLAALTHVSKARDLGSLPAASIVHGSLQSMRDAVRIAQSDGEVLFMDQRQLLTFGFVADVPLVGEYEKKRLMDEALSGNASFFRPFYRDLAAHRFSLIISSPLRTPIRDSDYGFGEENNAWVEWVARPVLCYYVEQDTLNEVKVELLVPRSEPTQCAAPMP
jgi:hypothetical protein